MANNFQSGHLIKFLVTPVGLAQTELGIKSHNLDHEVLLHDVTNTKHGGGTARIGGKEDCRGTVTAALDNDEQPWDGARVIFPGAIGLMFFGIGTGIYVQIPYIVGKLHWESAIDAAVTWSFEVSMNVLAGSLVLP